MKIELYHASLLLLPWIFGQTTAQLGGLQANTIQPVVSVYPILFVEPNRVSTVEQQSLFAGRIFSPSFYRLTKTLNLLVMRARTIIVKMYGVQT